MSRINFITRICSVPAALTLLTACGIGSNSSTNPSSAALSASSSTSANSISSYYPASGAYTTVPTQVVVNFASSSIDSNTGSADTTYSINCGGSSYYASGASVVSGSSSVTVTLPAISGLANGTVCTFSVGLNLLDGNGNNMSGAHSVEYTYSTSGAVLSTTGGTWADLSYSTATSAVGSAQGTPFSFVPGNTGTVLTGLMIAAGTYVDGAAGLWSNGFSSTNVSQGETVGSTPESFTNLSCPTGMRMTGITGRSGSFVDAIGIICMNEAQTQTYTSSIVGGPGGASYTVTCPAGMFATDLDGVADGYVNEIYLGCR